MKYVIFHLFKSVSQVALVVKNLPANAEDVRDTGLIPMLGRSPGGEHGNPHQYSCLENPHGERSLVGYSPWGCKELYITERLTFFFLTQSYNSDSAYDLRFYGLNVLHLKEYLLI